MYKIERNRTILRNYTDKKIKFASAEVKIAQERYYFFCGEAGQVQRDCKEFKSDTKCNVKKFNNERDRKFSRSNKSLRYINRSNSSDSNDR